MKKNSIKFLACLFLLTIFSCKRELKRPQWDVNMLVPLLKTNLSIANMLADSLKKVNGDSSVSIIYQTGLYNIALDSFVKLPDTILSTAVRVDSLKLGTITTDYTYTMSQLFVDLGASAPAQGSPFFIPPISGIASGSFDIDMGQYLQTADVTEGYIDVSITNGFPINITDLIYEIRNKIAGNVLLRDTFPNIPSGASDKHTRSIAGKTVEGVIVIQIVNMNSPGGAFIYDSTDAVIVSTSIYDVHVSSATAKFPQQNIVNSTDSFPIQMDNGAELTKCILRSGGSVIDIVSTAPDTIYFTYSIEKCWDVFGNPFLVSNQKVPPPAIPGDTIHFYIYYDLSGYTLDLTGPTGSQFNMMQTKMVARLDSTGKMVTFTLNDSFIINSGFKNLTPEYVEGYLGKDSISIGPDETVFSFFDKISSGSIDLEDAKLSLSVENGIGVDGIVNINSIKAVNTRNSTSQTLAGSIVNSPFIITDAIKTPFTPSFNSLNMNNTNSNSQKLISILPDKFQYDLLLSINPGGNNNFHGDFAYSSGGIDISINLEIPLSLSVNQIALADTTDIDLTKEKSPEKIRDGILNLLVDNGFPLEAELKLFLMDETNVIDSLVSGNRIVAAPLDAFGRVTAKQTTKLIFPIDAAKKDKLFKTKRVSVRVGFTSQPQGKYVKIYSDYRMDMTLTGKFNYIVDGVK